MPPRDTRTGNVLERMILPALECGGYQFNRQVLIGQRLGSGGHKIDLLAEKDGRQILLSMKWQQTSGSTEQKVPFEVICLIEALDNPRYAAAYLVLGGEGWNPRVKDFYLSNGLDRYLKNADKVRIVGLEAFVAKANQGDL